MRTTCDSTRPAAGWPLERILFAMAGTVALTGGLLALLVSPWFALLPVLAGLNQWLFVLVGDCPASLLLRRFARVRPASGSPR